MTQGELLRLVDELIDSERKARLEREMAEETETETETETEPGLVLELGARSRRPPSEPVQALCPFRLDGARLVATPQRPFLPHGLMLWDVPDGARVTILVGNNLQLIVEYGPLPARWFSALESFAQVAAAIDAGKEPPAWGKWDAVNPGVFIRLEFSARNGPERIDASGIQALMWGRAIW